MIKYSKYSFLFISFIVFIISFLSCSDNGKDDFGNYIEGHYTDEIVLTSSANKVFIVIEQLRLIESMKNEIPYSIINDQQSQDTIKLSLDVSFGSYNIKPEVFDEVITSEASIYIWYSICAKGNIMVDKTNSINAISTSPKITFVSIDSVTISKNVNKEVELITELIE
jgi:hypothetical protein